MNSYVTYMDYSMKRGYKAAVDHSYSYTTDVNVADVTYILNMVVWNKHQKDDIFDCLNDSFVYWFSQET